MTPERSLARATAYLDEATENLTFDEFLWAFEEAWHGVAWALNALADPPDAALDLGPRGGLPDAGALFALRASLNDPTRAARVVARLESLRAKLERATDLEIAQAVHAEQIERLVFEAWELHDSCGQQLGLVDDRLGRRLLLSEVSPGRVGSQVIHRRTALKLLAASTVVSLQACSKAELAPSPTAARPVEESRRAQIRAVTPLDSMHWPTSDPFIFCAHHHDDYPQGNEAMGPAASLQGRQLGRDFADEESWRMYHGRTVPGFPRHPHRGFETVTVVRTGLLDHSDSMGATARYGGGDVQWLTAGGGIQHAEMFPLLAADAPNPLELFQIWLNLPATDKMVDPYFTMLWNETIPRVVEHDAAGRITELTLAAGRYRDQNPPSPPPSSWASRADTEVAIWTVRMEAAARFELPAASSGTLRSLYVFRGAGVRVEGRGIANAHRVEVDHGPVALEAGSEEAEILVLQGRPIGEPVAKRGPFVMNTQQEIREAYADYQRSQFGGWPWRGDDPVHVRDRGRFARHIDGRFEEPT